jgi:tRNA-intron endonuclease, archaea type
MNRVDTGDMQREAYGLPLKRHSTFCTGAESRLGVTRLTCCSQYSLKNPTLSGVFSYIAISVNAAMPSRPVPMIFRVFRRGERPGTGQSQYLVRVISERDLVDFSLLLQETATSSKMRKQHILAVVDDENELTYYEAKVQPLPVMAPAPSCPVFDAFLAGRNAVARLLPGAPEIPGSFGMRLDPGRLLLSPLETLYLLQTGCIRLQGPGGPVGEEEYCTIASGADVELAQKATVYTDLRNHGYVPRTGYKFGHHFRVYTGQKVHSDMLVHAVAGNASLPMSTISRSVRLSHSVKKKMLFGCVHSTGIHYLEFARVKL